jgi:hypothetical protein
MFRNLRRRLHVWRESPGGQFASDIGRMILEFRWFSLAIVGVTVFQEVASLWPVNLLGRFIDGLGSGDTGRTLVLLFGAGILAPAIARGNVILRHRMFYESDFRARVQMTLRLKVPAGDVEASSKANSRVLNAVGSITNAAYHVVGSFTPVVIKILVVSGSLLAYNALIGWAFIASLSVPIVLTWAANRWLRKLRDSSYFLVSATDGAGSRLISAPDGELQASRFVRLMRQRRNVNFTLLARSQITLYFREAALVGSQFLVVLLALLMRERLGITAGDFTRIVGYTAQVSIAFLNTAACLDAVISYSRAWHVYDETRPNGNGRKAIAAD